MAFEILTMLALAGIFGFLIFLFCKWYEECKKEGVIHKNNGEESDDAGRDY